MRRTDADARPVYANNALVVKPYRNVILSIHNVYDIYYCMSTRHQ